MKTRLRVATPAGESGALLAQDAKYLFRYQDDASARAAISLLMPVRLDDYRHRELHPIFQMNLPEGYVLEQLRNRLAKLVPLDPMALLALTGSSSPIGRVTVTSPEIDTLLERQRFPGERLNAMPAWPPPTTSPTPPLTFPRTCWHWSCWATSRCSPRAKACWILRKSATLNDPSR